MYETFLRLSGQLAEVCMLGHCARSTHTVLCYTLLLDGDQAQVRHVLDTRSGVTCEQEGTPQPPHPQHVHSLPCCSAHARLHTYALHSAWGNKTTAGRVRKPTMTLLGITGVCFHSASETNVSEVFQGDQLKVIHRLGSKQVLSTDVCCFCVIAAVLNWWAPSKKASALTWALSRWRRAAAWDQGFCCNGLGFHTQQTLLHLDVFP